MKKKEKNKVGRPKLASKKTKKKALAMILLSIVLITVLILAGSVTTLKIDTNKLKAETVVENQDRVAHSTSACYNDPAMKLGETDTCNVAMVKNNKTGALLGVCWNCNANYVVDQFSIYEGSASKVGNKMEKHNIFNFKVNNYKTKGYWAIDADRGYVKNKNYFSSFSVSQFSVEDLDWKRYGVSNSKSIKNEAKTKEVTTKSSSECTLKENSDYTGTQQVSVTWACGSNATFKKIWIVKKGDKDKTIDKSTDKDKKVVTLTGLAPKTNYIVYLKYKTSDTKTININVKTKSDDSYDITGVSGVTNTSGHTASAGFAKGKAQKDLAGKSKNITCQSGSVTDLVDKYWGYIMILAPIALIILITIDFVKAVVASDADALKKSGSAAFKRAIAVIILLFLPILLRILLGWFGIEFCL